MVGGPAILTNRYHETGVTNIGDQEMAKWRRARAAEFQGEGRLSQDEMDEQLTRFNALPRVKIVGYDANALYLSAIMEDMPTGVYAKCKCVNVEAP